jgi:hypothetical protein
MNVKNLTDRIIQLERQVKDLQKDSHPPFDLTEHIKREVEKQLLQKC